MVVTRTAAVAAVSAGLIASGVLLSQSWVGDSVPPKAAATTLVTSGAAPLPIEEVVARAAARAALVRLCEEGLSNPEAKAQYERARAAHPRDAAGIGPDCLLVNLFSSAP
jgi:hypothetical protein